MPSLSGFKAYGRFNPDDTDPTIELSYNAAIEAATDGGVSTELINSSDKATLYIYALALHYYDNRGFMPSSQAYAVDEYARRMMSQMAFELKVKTRYGGEDNS